MVLRVILVRLRRARIYAQDMAFVERMHPAPAREDGREKIAREDHVLVRQ
jgi:hypothetical protein